MTVGAGRRGSVVAGLETVPPASLLFANISLSLEEPAPDPQHEQSSTEADDDLPTTRLLLDDVSGIARDGELVVRFL